MGVNGLWKLLEPSGKPVPVESLENQVLAVDVSIWLHQVTKGFQDASGNPLPNAHLLGLFHRLCKLLFYKIKPVFVFDGGVPHLKKQTVAARRQLKSKAEQTAEKMREQLLKNLIKHKAVKNVLGGQAWPAEVSLPRVQTEDDMFRLPPPAHTTSEDSGSESADESISQKYFSKDLHSLDLNSAHFLSLPADMRHDILVEMKETRKQSSWGRLHELPKESNDFSNYQMKRLLKRRSVQVCLEEAEKEMGGKTLSLGELEELMTDNGIITESNVGKRIASDNITRFIFISGKQMDATTKPVTNIEENEGKNELSTTDNKVVNENVEVVSNDKTECKDFEYMETVPGSDDETEIDNEWFFEPTKNDSLDVSSKLKVAQNFMFENSGLTQEQILAVIKTQSSPKKPERKNLYSAAIPSTSKMNIEETIITVPSTSQAIHAQDKTHNIRKEQTICLTNNELNKESQDKFANASVLKPKRSEITANVLLSGTEQSVMAIPDEESVSESEAGFVEVEDLPPCVFMLDKTKTNTAPLEVVIQTDKTDLGEDIFADIFSEGSDNEHQNEEDLKATSNLKQTVQITGTNGLDTNSKREEHTENKTVLGLEPNSGSDRDGEIIKPDRESVRTTFGSMLNNVKGDAASFKDNKITDAFDTVSVNLQSGLVSSKESKMTDLQADTNTTLTKNMETRSDKTTSPLHVSSLENRSEFNSGAGMETETIPEVGSLQKTVHEGMTSEDLRKLQYSLEDEHDRLLSEKAKQDRLAASITDQMYAEAQELLQLFGVPYIVAPMEAEAQCAFLDAISLTNGTITDDSDIWLFGGLQVYKNFFNQKKHVMKFRAADIQHYFKLTRQQMILLALLVGSDYTVGLQGIGPVTALEILATFASSGTVEQEQSQVEAPLQKFRDWLDSGRSMGPGKTALRNKVKDIKLHAGFPSIEVVDAYLNPKVDNSKEKFSWSTPDLASLRLYAMEKFGWAKTKTDSILLPVMKKIQEKNNQQTLDFYVQRKPKLPLPEGKLSKRVQHAVDHMDAEYDSSSGSENPAPQANRESATSQKVRGKRGRGSGRGMRGGRGGQTSNSIQEPEEPNNKVSGSSTSTEFILQREKDKLASLKNKLKAIEVFRKSKTGLDRTKRQKRMKRQELVEVKLSESSDSN